MTFAMTLLGGWEYFMIAVLVLLTGVIYGTYTRRGSGIDHHPYMRRYGDAPGAARRSEISGREGIARLSSRGTR
jgi:hypothetical protein